MNKLITSESVSSLQHGKPAHESAVELLVRDFSSTAAHRDETGGTAKRERDLIRQSGLLRLSVSKGLGGEGASWIETLAVVRRLASADSSLAHLFAFHHLMLATLHFFGTADQANCLSSQTVKHNWFWGNALNPLDTRLQITLKEGGAVLNGIKSFCSGASDSDMLIVSAIDASGGALRIAAIPTQRLGIHIHDDWDNIGQRQTDSGTVSFQNVHVSDHELLLSPGPLGSPFASLRPSLAQLILTNIYVGIAEGALTQAREYLHELPDQAFGKISEDAYVLRNFGELWAEISAAKALADQAVVAFQHGWDAGYSVSPQLRGEIAITIAAAKVNASRASLNVSNRIFEVMGARSTTAKRRLDRFWRNARTHTLHDPLDYKLKELGQWVLNDQIPTPSFYS